MKLSLHPAPFFQRFFAYALDLAIIGTGVYLAFIVLMMFGVFSFSMLAAFTGHAKDKQTAGLFFLVFFIGILLFLLLSTHVYFILFESKKGYTPGKKIFGLRVCSVDGGRLTTGQCVMRDMFRYIDCMMIFPGLLTILLTKQNQRLGDLVANTLVTYSKHREQSANYLYVKKSDFLLLREQWKPDSVPLDVCRQYLQFAYGFFRDGAGHASDVAHWEERAASYVHTAASNEPDSKSLLLFFAELCFQTLQEDSKRSST
jgi:uncharacterized RDD family membrane protein YckC